MRRSLATAALAAVLTLAAAVPASAQGDDPSGRYQRGPAPTQTSAEGTGAFAVERVVVPDAETPGFGAADLYLPRDRSQGTFGGVVLMPGLNGTRGTLSWLAPRLASQGFVVLLVDTPTLLDPPSVRARTFEASLGWLRRTSLVEGVLDRERLAVWGWSMAAGGSLREARQHPELRAAVHVFPWDVVKDFAGTTVPSLVLAAQLDTTALNDVHSRPMFASLAGLPDRGFAELRGVGHLRPLVADPRLSELTTAWLKIYVDEDLRYRPVLCEAVEDPALYTDHETPTCG